VAKREGLDWRGTSAVQMGMEQNTYTGEQIAHTEFGG
jgi:hypothetical protein